VGDGALGFWAALRVAGADLGSVTDYGRLFRHS
jgi:hypothetical protein